MRPLAVIGPAASGKTAVALGLALLWREQGVRVGYFKPVAADRPPPDPDVVLMHRALGLAAPVDRLSLLPMSSQYLTRYHRQSTTHDWVERARARLDELSKPLDTVLVGGAPLPFAMGGIQLDSISLAAALRLPVLFVFRVEHDYSLDRALLYNEYAAARGLQVVGTVFNHVPPTLVEKCAGVYRPLLESRGFRVRGLVPRDEAAAAPTVAEYRDALDADVLCCDDRLDRRVEEIVVGAMTLETAFPVLRRVARKAVVTGGDRADLALAALETDTSVVILTGGAFPDLRVLSRAEERGVPILLSGLDTLQAVERLHDVAGKLKPEDATGIAAARAAVARHVDWGEILAAIREKEKPPSDRKYRK